jgi:hypothetical protein
VTRIPDEALKLGRAAATIKPTDADKAYAAGFFDGDGHITIGANHRAAGTRNTIYTMRIGVSQNDPAPLFWFRDRWGGSVRAAKRKTAASNVTYHWGCFARNAACFLQDVRPLLQVKATRADVALAFQARLFNPGARGHTEEYRAGLVALHEQLAVLNTHKPLLRVPA